MFVSLGLNETEVRAANDLRRLVAGAMIGKTRFNCDILILQPREVMPRYYFHLFNKPFIDDDGHVQADDAAALAYATRVASELKGEYDSWCVVVLDEEGRNIGKVKVREAATLSQDDAGLVARRRPLS